MPLDDFVPERPGTLQIVECFRPLWPLGMVLYCHGRSPYTKIGIEFRSIIVGNRTMGGFIKALTWRQYEPD